MQCQMKFPVLAPRSPLRSAGAAGQQPGCGPDGALRQAQGNHSKPQKLMGRDDLHSPTSSAVQPKSCFYWGVTAGRRPGLGSAEEGERRQSL